MEPTAVAVPLVPLSARALLLGSGPRFARDAFGPMLLFYVTWKLAGLAAGILAATVLAMASWRWEVRRERPGVMARVTLALVLGQAAIGLIADDARVYLAQPVLIGAMYGLAFLGSAVLGRPLAGTFATEMYEFPPEVRASATFRKVFGRVSMAWGVYLLARSVVRILVLTRSSVDAFMLVNLLTGFPFMTALISWSVWYGLRGFRRSEEWGWAFAGTGQA
jgi:intracellular septation protein A